MKTKIIFFLLFLTVYLTNAQSLQWVRATSSGTINEYGYAIAVDAAGNAFTTGYFTGTPDFDPGSGTFTMNCLDNGDIYISKLDAAGNFLWAKQMVGGGSSGDAGESLTLDAAGNIYLAGRYTASPDMDPGPGTFMLVNSGGFDAFIAKYDPNGNFIWATSITGGGANDIAKDIAVDPLGNVYTTGYFSGTPDFDGGSGTFFMASAGGDDIFVTKHDASGNFVWAGRLGGGFLDQGNGIDVDAAGNVYTTGRTLGGDFDPGTGTFNLAVVSGSDIFVSKLNTSGAFVWAMRMGASGTDISYAIKLDAAGNNVHTTGTFNNTVDFDPGPGTFNMTDGGSGADMFISKLTSAGTFVWAKGMLGGQTSGFGITVDAVGDVYTTGNYLNLPDFNPGTGTYTLTNASNNDMFISKLDASGNFVWAKAMIGTSFEGGRSIAIDNSCNLYVVGDYQATTDFDPDATVVNMTANGMYDAFVMKLFCTAASISESEMLADGLSIYPNPSSGEFTLQLKEELKAGELIVTDVMGKEILKQELNGIKEVEVKLETKGLYFVRLESEGKRIVKKIVVQ